MHAWHPTDCQSQKSEMEGQGRKHIYLIALWAHTIITGFPETKDLDRDLDEDICSSLQCTDAADGLVLSKHWLLALV